VLLQLTNLLEHSNISSLKFLSLQYPGFKFKITPSMHNYKKLFYFGKFLYY